MYGILEVQADLNLTLGISFIARVPCEEFLVISDNFEVEPEKISDILGNKFVYMPIIKADKKESIEKILGCDIYSVKCSLSKNKCATVIVPLQKVSDTIWHWRNK